MKTDTPLPAVALVLDLPPTVQQDISPFALIVDPSIVHAAARRMAQSALPRIVVKAFLDKEKNEPARRSARKKKTDPLPN